MDKLTDHRVQKYQRAKDSGTEFPSFEQDSELGFNSLELGSLTLVVSSRGFIANLQRPVYHVFEFATSFMLGVIRFIMCWDIKAICGVKCYNSKANVFVLRCRILQQLHFLLKTLTTIILGMFGENSHLLQTHPIVARLPSL